MVVLSLPERAIGVPVFSSIMATRLFVVPRSIPSIISFFCRLPLEIFIETKAIFGEVFQGNMRPGAKIVVLLCHLRVNFKKLPHQH